jgi:GT2 family glycosyltransferase
LASLGTGLAESRHVSHISRATGSQTPVVSVVTPAYNAARYLPETLRSVLGQTFSDLELIIVDDGSTDDTLAVARRLAATDCRVRIIATPNSGPAAARNTALRSARGAFVALLDSDDLMAPEYLARQLAVFDAFPEASVVTANAVNRGGGPTYDGKPFWPPTAGYERITLHQLIEHEDSMCIFSVFRRAICSAVGVFNAAFTGNEDYEFWLRAAIAGFVLVRNNEPIGVYRRHDDSLSSNEPRMIRGVLAVLRNLRPMLEDRPQEWEAAERQIARFTAAMPRAELRASLQRRDAAAASRVLQGLASARGGWPLTAIARLTAYWPQPLLWAYRLRHHVRSA